MHKFNALDAWMLHQNRTSSSSGDEPLGLIRNTVQIHSYSPRWPELFARELCRLREALAPFTPAIEHIGSTAVADLVAKPIIDILVGVENVEEKLAVCSLLAACGYEAHGEKGVPGRLFFSEGEPPRYHLHLVDHNGSIWQRHLEFRDLLRRDPAVAMEYAQLKRRLAQKFSQDRDSYTSSKANFIENALREA